MFLDYFSPDIKYFFAWTYPKKINTIYSWVNISIIVLLMKGTQNQGVILITKELVCRVN